MTLKAQGGITTPTLQTQKRPRMENIGYSMCAILVITFEFSLSVKEMADVPIACVKMSSFWLLDCSSRLFPLDLLWEAVGALLTTSMKTIVGRGQVNVAVSITDLRFITTF